MRILSIVSDLKGGGTQRVAVDVAKLYLSAGYDSAVLTRLGGGPRASDVEDAGITSFIADRDDPKKAEAEAMAWHPDIIHIHRPGLSNPAESRLLRLFKEDNPSIRVIEHSHFGRADYSKDRSLIDVHIQISLWCLWAWRRWTRAMKPEPIGVCIPHSADLSRFEPLTSEERRLFREQKGIATDAFVYGYIAQPVKTRWTPPLFEAFSTVLRKRPNSHLYVAGLGDNFPELHESLPEDVRSKITIDGFLHGDEKLRQAYGAMDTFVHNSHLGETFGLVLTESMSCGTPVITVAKPLRGNAQCEVVRNGKGGMVVADESHLADAMTRMQDETEEHERMRIEGRSSVENRYSKTIVDGMVLGLAEHVMMAHDREELRQKLQSDPLFRTHINRAELSKESGGLFGSSSVKDRCMQKALMTPVFQRLLSLAKRRRLR